MKQQFLSMVVQLLHQKYQLLKESYGGLVVGTNSYGKGTVQQTKKLLDGSMIKYTTQKWLTPEGNFIKEVGVTPTNEVKLNEEYYSNPSDDNDNQLQEALNLLTKQHIYAIFLYN